MKNKQKSTISKNIQIKEVDPEIMRRIRKLEDEKKQLEKEVRDHVFTIESYQSMEKYKEIEILNESLVSEIKRLSELHVDVTGEQLKMHDVIVELQEKNDNIIKENKKIKTENSNLKNEIKTHREAIYKIHSNPELLNPKEGIFCWQTHDGESITYQIPKKILENIDHINDFIERVVDNNVIFFKDFYEYSKNETRIPHPWLGKMQQQLIEAINSGKLKIEPPKLPTINEIIKEADFESIRIFDMKKCVKFFIENKNKELSFGKIPIGAQLSQTTVSKYIPKLIKIGWVKQLPNKKYIWIHLSENEVNIT